MVAACTTDDGPSTLQGLFRTATSITIIAVTGIITIVLGLWGLLIHRGAHDEEKLIAGDDKSAFVTSSSGRTFRLINSKMTMLVDSGATEHFLGDELFPDLKDRLDNPTQLNVLETIITAGNRNLLGTMTGTIHGTISD